MTVSLTALVIAAVLPLKAQQPRVILEGQIGGDSARSRTVVMQRPNSYRIEVRPASAELVVRGVSSSRGYGQSLALNPLVGDSVPGGRGFIVMPEDSATYSIALASGSPIAIIRVIEVVPGRGDVASGIGRDELLLSEIVGVSPTYMWLDTGIVYRFFVQDEVYLSPRSVGGAPVRLAPLVRGGGHGAPFMANQAGEYAIFTLAGSAPVRVYRSQADAAELACIRDRRTEGCSQSNRPTSPRNRIGLLIAAAIGATVVLLAFK